MATKTNVLKNINVKNRGSGNGRWTGGKNSYYSNHYQLKLNRKAKLKECDNKCMTCGAENVILNASRLDGDKNNHDMDNLIMLCSKCMGGKASSKYKRMYGSTLNELCHEFGVSLTTLYKFIPDNGTKAKIKKAVDKYVKEKNALRFV
jgi:hypothetical protein